MQDSWFDFMFIQFYGGDCGVQSYGIANGSFNFAAWATWATTISKNPNVALFLGVPAAPGAALSGWVEGKRQIGEGFCLIKGGHIARRLCAEGRARAMHG